MVLELRTSYESIQALFGTRVFVGNSRDNPHQTPYPQFSLKVCLALVYWASLIPTFPHLIPNSSVYSSILNTLPLPSGLVGIGVR
jgi:hypothetical protein